MADKSSVTGLWPVPTDWGWTRLDQLGVWFGGGTPSKAKPEYWSQGKIPWVSPKDMKRAVIDGAQDMITDAAIANSAAKMVPANSVLCVMRSGILAHTFPVATNTVPVALRAADV